MAPITRGKKISLSMGVRRAESTLGFGSDIGGGCSSANRVKLFNGEAAGDDRNRDTKARERLAGQIGDQRAWSFGTGPGREHQDRDAWVFVDQGQQLVAAGTLADINDRHRAGDWQDLFAQPLHELFGFFTLLCTG